MKRTMLQWAVALGIAATLAACGFSGGTAGGDRPANVGNEAGNGGHGVVCRNGHRVKSVELLDYYEARLLMPELTPDLQRGSTEMEKALAVLERLERVDALRAARYRKAVENFFEDARFIDQALLGSTNDYGYVPLENDCRVEQIVVQRKTPFPEMKRYLVQQSLWNRLTVEHRAGLILHEVIYGHALELGHRDSVATRYFNALVSSKKLETMPEATFGTLMASIGLSDAGSAAASPSWIAPTLALSSARIGEAYEVTLRPYVRYAGNDSLVFTSSQLPKGLVLDRDGRLWTHAFPDAETLGQSLPPSILEIPPPTSLDPDESAPPYMPPADDTPAYAAFQIGFPVTVATRDGAHVASAKVSIRVIPPQVAEPYWLQNPIMLPSAKEDVAYSVDLRSMVRCNGKVVFSGSNLPSWARLVAAGALVGTPSKADVGTSSFLLRADCNGRSAQTKMSLQVLHVAIPPIWVQDPIPLKATVGRRVVLNLNEFVRDSDDAPLKFQLVVGPAWLAVGGEGTLYGLPALADAGPSRASVQVSNGVLTSQATIVIEVASENLAPQWLEDPIQLKTPVGSPFTASLAGYVQNTGGSLLSFYKLSGPAWLCVDRAGRLMGTPGQKDVGENRFEIRLRTKEGECTATVVVEVLPR